MHFGTRELSGRQLICQASIVITRCGGLATLSKVRPLIMSSAPPARVELCFLNTAHPDDATAGDNLSRIRSHVARTIHARARQPRVTHPSSCHPKQGRQPTSQVKSSASAEQRLQAVSYPRTALKDPYQVLKRPLSRHEEFLFHHCTPTV